MNSCHQIQYLKDIGGGITDMNKNVSEVIEQLRALHTSVNQIIERQKNTGGKPVMSSKVNHSRMVILEKKETLLVKE